MGLRVKEIPQDFMKFLSLASFWSGFETFLWKFFLVFNWLKRLINNKFTGEIRRFWSGIWNVSRRTFVSVSRWPWFPITPKMHGPVYLKLNGFCEYSKSRNVVGGFAATCDYPICLPIRVFHQFESICDEVSYCLEVRGGNENLIFVHA